MSGIHEREKWTLQRITEKRAVPNVHANYFGPRLTGRHWASPFGSPRKSLGPFPSESGSLRVPDVSWPLVDGKAAGRPPLWIFVGPRPEDREEFASDKRLMDPLSPRASPINNSDSLRLRFGGRLDA